MDVGSVGSSTSSAPVNAETKVLKKQLVNEQEIANRLIQSIDPDKGQKVNVAA